MNRFSTRRVLCFLETLAHDILGRNRFFRGSDSVLLHHLFLTPRVPLPILPSLSGFRRAALRNIPPPLARTFQFVCPYAAIHCSFSYKRSPFMFTSARLLCVPLLVAASIALPVSISAAPNAAADDRFQIGSSNTVTADPFVPRPNEKPCIVQLFSGFQFVNFNTQSYQFTPPANCPGPWEKVVFTADFNVTAGRQFDRTAIVDLGFVNIYFGTTAEPRHNLSPTWHVERDETDYSALFESPQSGQVI